ncbi:hypothetical protein [Marimonas lutisalis]|nr:hypothetical protein [Marimonas lutisalis]
MKKQPRWINSVIETAKTESTAMPWQRGGRRAAFITKRNASPREAKTA